MNGNKNIPSSSFAKGFTLLEVLVAVFVLGLISTLVWQSFSQTVRSKNYVEAGNEMYHQLRWTLDKLTYDLSCAFIGKGKNEGLSGFVGTNKFAGEGIPQDELNFLSFSHIRYNPEEKSSDQCELGYFVAQDPSSGKFVLFRREDYTLDGNHDGGEVNELVEGIVAFNLRYFDGESWHDNWDSRNPANSGDQIFEVSGSQTEEMIDQIPIAVEVIVSMVDEDGQEVFMNTKIRLMLSSIDLAISDEEDDEGSSGSDTTSPTPASKGSN